MTAWLSGHDLGAASDIPVFQVTRAAGPVSAPGLRLMGELDFASAPLLTAAGLVLAGEGELLSGLDVPVDLSELSFLDSSGLTALNDVAVQLTRAGATGITLIQATRPVLLLLTLASAAGQIGPGIGCARLTTPAGPAAHTGSNQGHIRPGPVVTAAGRLNQPDVRRPRRAPAAAQQRATTPAPLRPPPNAATAG